MNYGSCMGCNKSIAYDKVRLCLECDQKYREKVRDFVRNNREASSEQVAEATGVPVKIVTLYIKAGVISEIDTEMKDRSKRLVLMGLKKAISGGALEEEPKKQYGMTGKYHFITKEYREAHPNRFR